MPDEIISINANIECACGDRPVAFFRAMLRKVGDEWVVLVPTDQDAMCDCGRTYQPEDPAVDMPVTYRAPIRKGVEVTARVKLLETNGGD